VRRTRFRPRVNLALGLVDYHMTTAPSLPLQVPMQDLEPLDPSYVTNVLSNPPFVTISGVINVRDLGGYPSIDFPDKSTVPRTFFRSAELSSITEEGT
jgi:hypothetical protein